MELNEYFKKIISTSHYPITFSGDKPGYINRWLVKGVPAENVSCSAKLAPYLDTEGELLFLGEVTYSNERLESNWRHYTSKTGPEEDIDFSHNYPHLLFSDDSDKYIYSLSSIYCSEKKYVFFHVLCSIPVRVWVNGQLVFLSSYKYHIKPGLFVVGLEEGSNTILVEKAVLAEYKRLNAGSYFLVDIIPYEQLVKSRIKTFLDEALLPEMELSYAIYPDAGYFLPGQDISFTVLPRWFGKSTAELIRISILNADGKVLESFEGFAPDSFSVALKRSIKGTLQIKVDCIDGLKHSSTVCVFRGDFYKEIGHLVNKASGRRDCNRTAIECIKGLSEIPDIYSGCFGKWPELWDKHPYLLDRLAEFERYLNSPNGSHEKPLFEIFPKNVMLFKKSDIDDGFTAFIICFPKGYSPSKKYPLSVSMNYGVGISTYPIIQRYEENQNFDEAVIISFCGSGVLNRDYICEAEYLNIINLVLKNLNIDMDRIYLISSCAAVSRGFNMAIRMPGVFTAVAGITGSFRLDIKEPRYEYLENISNSEVYHLGIIEDSVFNFSRVSDINKRLKKFKTWSYYELQHNLFDVLLNSEKLFKKLVKERGCKYPKNIRYTIEEPIYNRSYWIRVEYIENLNHKAVIDASIISGERIVVRTENIRCFNLLLCKDRMGLNDDIELRVNNLTQSLKLSSYSNVSATFYNNVLTAEVTPITKESFTREYEHIGVDENLMGIKRVYLRKCIIIKPDYYKINKRAFARRLFYILQNPLKERVRAYKYDAFFESEVTEKDLGGSNFIYVIDSRIKSNAQQHLLNITGIKADAEGIGYNGTRYSGEYFAAMKLENPFSRTGSAVVIAFNTDNTENLLLDFLSSFDTNPMFYSNAVIYNKAVYYSFR